MRISTRAIIFHEDSIMVMYRNKEGREYYTFPGGGVNEGESLEDCVVREVKEEFGINVIPIKQVYKYVSIDSDQYFYLCKWVDGEFGTGDGEEFNEGNDNIYRPTTISIKNIEKMPLMPSLIKIQLALDIEEVGINLKDTVLTLEEGN